MAKELRFTSGLFDFLRELKANNKKEWFDANKDRYVADVRDPLLAFIAALRPRLLEISPTSSPIRSRPAVRCSAFTATPASRRTRSLTRRWPRRSSLTRPAERKGRASICTWSLAVVSWARAFITPTRSVEPK